MLRASMLFVLLAVVRSNAGEIEAFSTTAELAIGYGTEAEARIEERVELVPLLDVRLREAVSFVASARIRLDGRDVLEPGRAPLATYANPSKPIALGTAGTAELRDFYVEWRSARGLARIGKQQIAWGRLDGIKVLDVVNPQDFREFILDDLDNSRIGLWSAYFDYSVGDWRTEIALIPDATGHALPAAGAWFELTAPRFRYGFAKGGLALPVMTERPGLSLDETGVGLRVSRRFRHFGARVVGYSGMDPEPLGRLGGQTANARLERYYVRREVFGFSLDAGLGRAVLRGEIALQPGRRFNTLDGQALSAIALDQQRLALGLDLDGPLDIFINLQYLIDRVRDAPDTLVRPATDRIATLFLRRSFAYDRVAADARWFRSFTDNDELITLRVTYAVRDDLSITLAADAFNGDTAGIFGEFTARDRITVGVEYVF